MKICRKRVCFFVLLFAGLAAFLAKDAQAVRLKELVSVKGVRNNQLIGYGLVVGLGGTGDGKQAAFTSQGILNMLKNMGITMGSDSLSPKNVASVLVTAQLPPFVKAGQTIDVTLSSLGDSSSLQGGTLISTPLKGLDGKVYAIAQGAVSIGGFEVTGGAAPGVQKNHLTVARISNGASVEREVPVSFADKEYITFSLKNPDFTTVTRMVTAIDNFLGNSYATAIDGSTVNIAVPEKYNQQEIALLAALEHLDITPDMPAKVILDERTGTVVMGENVRIGQIAISHGNLSLRVGPGSRRSGEIRTPTTAELLESKGTSELILGDVQAVEAEGSRLLTLPSGTSLGEVVRALNSIGVTPRDMIAIFQSIKAAGALQAELEII